MADSHWLDRFAAELQRQHLPARYSARLLEELADHLSELEQETTSMDAQVLLEERIGRPEVIAAEARSEYTRRTFAGRHPVLTFGVAPLFTVIGSLLAALFVAWGAVWLLAMTTPQLLEEKVPPTPFQWFMVYCVLWFVRLVPFGLSAWLFTRVGRRLHRPNWGLLACTIVASLAFVFWMGIRTATSELQGQVFFGLAVQQLPHPEQFVQAALPLAIGLVSWWLMTRRKDPSTPALSPM
jgi:hypothetical protein